MKFAMIAAFVVASLLFSVPAASAGCEGGSCSVGRSVARSSSCGTNCGGRRVLFQRLRARR